jgi:hypothetical protein
MAYALIISLYLLAMCTDVHPNPGPMSRTHVLDKRNIKLCNFNIRSINTKDRFDHIKEKIPTENDIITVTETWLKPEIPNSKFKLVGFDGPFRLDRPEGRAGGVMTWVKHGIIANRMSELEIPTLECIWMRMRVDNQVFLVGTAIASRGVITPPSFGTNFKTVLH